MPLAVDFCPCFLANARRLGGANLSHVATSTVAAERWLTWVITREETQLRFEILTMRVQLHGLTGDTSVNGQCGQVGGFEGERVFVRLDNSNRVLLVKTRKKRGARSRTKASRSVWCA